MIKELYLRFPKILFIYKIMRAIGAVWGYVWLAIGIIFSFRGLLDKQVFTLQWISVLFFAFMGIVYFIKINRYKPQTTPVIGDIAKYHHLDEPTGNVSYMNPVEDFEKLKKEGERVRSSEYWGKMLNSLKKKPYIGDEYKPHRIYCLKMMKETRNIIEFNHSPIFK